MKINIKLKIEFGSRNIISGSIKPGKSNIGPPHPVLYIIFMFNTIFNKCNFLFKVASYLWWIKTESIVGGGLGIKFEIFGIKSEVKSSPKPLITPKLNSAQLL